MQCAKLKKDIAIRKINQIISQYEKLLIMYYRKLIRNLAVFLLNSENFTREKRKIMIQMLFTKIKMMKYKIAFSIFRQWVDKCSKIVKGIAIIKKIKKTAYFMQILRKIKQIKRENLLVKIIHKKQETIIKNNYQKYKAKSHFLEVMQSFINVMKMQIQNNIELFDSTSKMIRESKGKKQNAINSIYQIFLKRDKERMAKSIKKLKTNKENLNKICKAISVLLNCTLLRPSFMAIRKFNKNAVKKIKLGSRFLISIYQRKINDAIKQIKLFTIIKNNDIKKNSQAFHRMSKIIENTIIKNALIIIKGNVRKNKEDSRCKLISTKLIIKKVSIRISRLFKSFMQLSKSKNKVHKFHEILGRINLRRNILKWRLLNQKLKKHASRINIYKEGLRKLHRIYITRIKKYKNSITKYAKLQIMLADKQAQVTAVIQQAQIEMQATVNMHKKSLLEKDIALKDAKIKEGLTLFIVFINRNIIPLWRVLNTAARVSSMQLNENIPIENKTRQGILSTNCPPITVKETVSCTDENYLEESNGEKPNKLILRLPSQGLKAFSRVSHSTNLPRLANEIKKTAIKPSVMKKVEPILTCRERSKVRVSFPTDMPLSSKSKQIIEKTKEATKTKMNKKSAAYISKIDLPLQIQKPAPKKDRLSEARLSKFITKSTVNEPTNVIREASCNKNNKYVKPMITSKEQESRKPSKSVYMKHRLDLPLQIKSNVPIAKLNMDLLEPENTVHPVVSLAVQSARNSRELNAFQVASVRHLGPKESLTKIAPKNSFENSNLFGDEVNQIGMAEPAELGMSPLSPDTFSITKDEECASFQINESKGMNKCKEELKKSKLGVGRYEHQRFMTAFSNCFLKYYEIAMNNGQMPKKCSNKENLPYMNKRKSHIEEHNITNRQKELCQKLRLKDSLISPPKKPNNGMWTTRNASITNQSCRPNEQINYTCLTGQSTMEDRNYLDINRKFISEMSCINHDIYSNIACQSHVPRFKIPKPELVFQLTVCKEKARSKSRTRIERPSMEGSSSSNTPLTPATGTDQ